MVGQISVQTHADALPETYGRTRELERDGVEKHAASYEVLQEKGDVVTLELTLEDRVRMCAEMCGPTHAQSHVPQPGSGHASVCAGSNGAHEEVHAHAHFAGRDGAAIAVERVEHREVGQSSEFWHQHSQAPFDESRPRQR